MVRVFILLPCAVLIAFALIACAFIVSPPHRSSARVFVPDAGCVQTRTVQCA